MARVDVYYHGKNEGSFVGAIIGLVVVVGFFAVLAGSGGGGIQQPKREVETTLPPVMTPQQQKEHASTLERVRLDWEAEGGSWCQFTASKGYNCNDTNHNSPTNILTFPGY